MSECIEELINFMSKVDDFKFSLNLMLELSSCENATNFYLDVFSEMVRRGMGNEILSIYLDIDRGVRNFDDFKDILTIGFYSLQELNINQNYTSNDCTDEENYTQFLLFLKNSN